MKRNILGWAVMVLVLTACQTPSPLSSQNIQSLKNYGITIKVAGSELKASSGPQGWNNKDRKDGYVGWGPGESGWVFFNLKNEDSGQVCGNLGDGKDAKWVMTELYLSAFPEVPDADEKGEKFGSPQPAWLQEAFPQVDLTDGSVFKAADKKDGVTFLSLANANAQEGDKLIYYRVTVEECSDNGGKLTLDPAFGNGGRR
jgi:hypothetical protein